MFAAHRSQPHERAPLRPAIDRRAILAAAWTGARALAAASARPAREHLGEAQRAAWAMAHAAAAQPAPVPVPAPRPTAPTTAQLIDVAAIGADDTGEVAAAACLALGDAIFAAVRRLTPVDRGKARSLARLGAAVELAALDWRDRNMAARGRAIHYSGMGRLH